MDFFKKLVLAVILPLNCKKRLNIVILLSKYDLNWESSNDLESWRPLCFLHQTIEEAEVTFAETKYIQKLLFELVLKADLDYHENSQDRKPEVLFKMIFPFNSETENLLQSLPAFCKLRVSSLLQLKFYTFALRSMF